MLAGIEVPMRTPTTIPIAFPMSASVQGALSARGLARSSEAPQFGQKAAPADTWAPHRWQTTADMAMGSVYRKARRRTRNAGDWSLYSLNARMLFF